MDAPSVRIKRFASAVTIALCLAFAVAVYSQEGFDLDPRALRERIDGFGWLAPVAYIAAAALRPFLGLPSWVVMSAGGLLFGVSGGILWGSIGFSLGAVLAFSIARGLGREAVAVRLQGRAASIERYVAERGAPWMALYTAVPVTVLTPVHLGAGLTGMSLLAFALAALGGFLPRTALYSFFGNSIAEGNLGRIGLALVLIAIGGGVGVVLVRRWGRRSAAAIAKE